MQSRKSEKGRQAAKTLCEELKTLIEDKWQNMTRVGARFRTSIFT